VNGFQLQLVPPPTVSSNAWLTSLALSPAGILSPTFASNTFCTYATTEVYGSEADGDRHQRRPDRGQPVDLQRHDQSASLGCGEHSGLNLTLGMTNVMQVQVTAQDGVTLQTYTMNVTELPNQATPPMLTNSVSNGTLNLNWGLDRLGYRLLIQTNNLVIARFCDGGTDGNGFSWLVVFEPTLKFDSTVNPMWPSAGTRRKQSGTTPELLAILLAIGFPSVLIPCCTRS
jgi:hypothetical protein